MISLYELEKENDELKRYIQFLEAKCKEYEKHYDIEIQCRNSLEYHSRQRIIPEDYKYEKEYDTEIIRIPERKFLVGCQDLSKIRKSIDDVFGGIV